MKKTLAALAIVALAVAGCSTSTSSEPVSPIPAPTLSVTTPQSMTDLLMPPTTMQPQEPVKGSLGVFIEDYAPQPVMDTFLDTYLPEGE